MIRAVIFDLDGTLYDRYSSLRAAAYQLHSEHRNWFPESMIAKELGRQLVKFDHRYNYFGGWPSVAEKLKTANVLLPEVDDREFGEAAISAMAESLVPYPFTLKMLADLLNDRIFATAGRSRNDHQRRNFIYNNLTFLCCISHRATHRVGRFPRYIYC